MHKLIVLGAGGHAKVLIDCLLQLPHIDIIGILDADVRLIGQEIMGVRVLGNDDLLKAYSPYQVQLVNGLGSIDIPQKRRSIYDKAKANGFHFFSVIHPTATIAQSVLLGEGVQVMAGCIIQAGSQVGANALINTRTTIDHDCHIHAHVHLAPGVILSGHVEVEEQSHVGTGAIVLQNIKIGRQCLIGAGAVVIRPVVAHHRIAGVPARVLKTGLALHEVT